MKKKILLSINISFFFLICYYLFNSIGTKELLNLLINSNYYLHILIFLFFIIRTFLTTYRWYLISSKFVSITYLNFHRNIILGSTFNVILSTPYISEVIKIFHIKKKLGLKKSLELILIEKLFIIFTKICFIIITINIFFYYYSLDLKEIILLLSILLPFFLLSIKNVLKKVLIFLNKIKILKKHSLNIKVSYKILKNISIKLFFLNLLIQLINILIYFLIFLSLGDLLNIINVSLYVPLIEFISMFQAIFYGLKELTIFEFFKTISTNLELALAGALIHRFLEFTTLFFLYLIFNIFFKNIEKL